MWFIDVGYMTFYHLLILFGLTAKHRNKGSLYSLNAKFNNSELVLWNLFDKGFVLIPTPLIKLFESWSSIASQTYYVVSTDCGTG